MELPPGETCDQAAQSPGPARRKPEIRNCAEAHGLPSTDNQTLPARGFVHCRTNHAPIPQALNLSSAVC